MARRYVRDRRGRFASVGATARGGRLTNMSGKRYATETKRMAGGGPVGTIRPGKRKPVAAKAVAATSNIRPLSRGTTGAPRALKANAVRSFAPKSPGLRSQQLGRQISREMKNAPPSVKDRLGTVMGRVDAITARMDRRVARDITDRNSSNPGKKIVSQAGRNAASNRPGIKVIQRRGQRAAAAAARGSKPAQRAREIYNNQLAYTGKGKPKAAKSNLRPGPRNTTGAPKRKRKPKR